MRRYPALAYLIGAVALALLLPSGLTLPNRGPSTLAEYAPVPGQGKGVSPISNFGEAASGDLGAGVDVGRPTGATTTSLGGAVVAPSRLIKKSGTKRCVGDPARQTEDPFSPPCVAFFDGDNGADTWKGVTKDEVTVVFGADGLGSTGEKHKGELVDCANAPDDTDGGDEVLCKAYMRFFNDRYQTYNRRVHLWMSHIVNPQEVDEKLHPFASSGSPGPSTKTLSIAFPGKARHFYQDFAPYTYTFRPDFEDSAAMTATFACTKLAGQPAKFAGDPLIQSQTRKFGVWMKDDDPYRPFLLAALKSTCGIDPMIVNVGGSADTSAAPTRFHQSGVTTVFIETGNIDFAVATQDATQQGYFPEWMVTGKPIPRLNDVNFYGRVADQNQWRHAFGITTDYRRDAVHDQWWYRAFREGCPDCAEPTPTGYSSASFLYDQYSLLFRAIQAAGPRLTPQSADKGMHAIPPNGSPDPYRPAAYFSPGNYSYLKDSMAIWWDPSGVAPGANNPGCYRLPEDGKRYRTGEWRPGTDELFALTANQPCQGDPFAT